jgi:hypothetical protein
MNSGMACLSAVIARERVNRPEYKPSGVLHYPASECSISRKGFLMDVQKPETELLLYQTEDGRSCVQVRLEGETVWMTQRLMAELFQVSVPTINEHLKNIFQEGELVEEAVIRKFRITAEDGKEYLTNHYNLEAILAVGYRVRSLRGTQFRKWATERLREYLVKGFVMDDERLKEVRNLGRDYFDELLERIRDIRASEKRFYQKIRDIYKLSVDYDPRTDETQRFFMIVQNKMHWAASGKTAAELIHERADAKRPNMGLTAWQGAKVRKADVTVAKNYLTEEEIRHLNRIVTMYLDYAEMQARARKPLYMRDWQNKLDAFLRFNEQEVLEDAGRVSMEVAKQLALDEYEKFAAKRRAVEATIADEEDLQIESEIRLIERTLKENKSNK